MINNHYMSKYWKFTDDDGEQAFRKPWKYDPATGKYIFITKENGKSKFLSVGPEWFKGRESQSIKPPVSEKEGPKGK